MDYIRLKWIQIYEDETDLNVGSVGLQGEIQGWVVVVVRKDALQKVGVSEDAMQKGSIGLRWIPPLQNKRGKLEGWV